MDGGGVAGVGFVAAGGDGPELLQLGEAVLDQVAPAVHVAVEVDGALAVGLGWDHRGGTTIVEVRPEPVGVEGLVAEQGVDQGDDLGGQPAARAADGLISSPPFAPLAFWCAATMVPSIRAYSKSGSADTRSKRRSKTPARTQRRNRWNTLFQWPNPLGRSRQGTPVRTRHSTASRNSRLSLPVALPGSRSATFAQTASLTTNRFRSIPAITPPKRSLNHSRTATGILNVNGP